MKRLTGKKTIIMDAGDVMVQREGVSFCRTCGGFCGVRLGIDEQGRLAQIKGDKEHPLTEGYACFKGLRAVETHNGPARLLHPLKRRPDGSFERIPLRQALDEIAEKLQIVIAAHGAQAVAIYRGTPNYVNAISYAFVDAWLKAIGSDSLFSTVTIDQPAKWVAAARLGYWRAGKRSISQSDVWLFAGHNPLVSHQGGGGFYANHPVNRMRQARERGMKVIVIDPRRSELTHYADIHLQIRPGEDAAVAAGLLHIVLGMGWEDREFCDRYVQGLDALRAAVLAFTPEYVAQRAGIKAEDLLAAAELFARQSRRGSLSTGTGANMGPYSNLAEHLYQTLGVVCGRFLRAGEQIDNPGILIPHKTFRAEVAPPQRTWEQGPHSRVKGWGRLFGEKLTGTLSDEILVPGQGQIRALIVPGGNPAVALPDQAKAVQALSSLDLLLSFDPVMSETARLAHYILPPTLQYERPDILPALSYPGYLPKPFSQYTDAVVAPPAGSEVVDEWRALWELARRLGKTLTLAGAELDMVTPPTAEQLLALLTKKAKVPLTEIRKYPSGKVFDIASAVVEPARPEASARFAVMPDDVASELTACLGYCDPPGYGYRLAVRRMRDVMNSTLRELDSIRKRNPSNPAWLHPDDMAALGLAAGDRLEIANEHGRVVAHAAPDERQKPGVVAVSHCWGGLPGDEAEAETAINQLISDSRVESISAMAWMTGIGVRLRRL
ncbi:MAG: molybdopterin-dependent oxidoreductase [Sulfuricaulis sp.]|nr:molybdopterin-dependent oxidoreductase [Sulfuricaulis sp.]